MLKTAKIFGKDIKVEVNSNADDSVFEEIFIDHDYKILDPYISKAKTCILDMGAHLGFFSIYARQLNSNVKIFAFEPEEQNFSVLKKNFENNFIKNVVAKNVAIDSLVGLKTLYLSRDSHNHSFVKEALEENLVAEKNVNAINFETIFEKYLKKGNINFVDIVKMDLEGAEFKILPSISPEIFKKIGLFYIEYHLFKEEFKLDKLFSIFSKNGFLVKKFSSFYDNRMGFLLALRKIGKLM